MNDIAKTGFTVSLSSYLLFALFDYLRPGFVSYVFSLHWFLAPIIVFAVLFVLTFASEKKKGLFFEIITLFLQFLSGGVIFILIWREGEIFGDFRIFLSLFGFLSPWLAMRLLKN